MYKTLEAAINVLDTNEGVSEDCYAFILMALPEDQAARLSPFVDATDGSFYIMEEGAAELRNEYGFTKQD